MQISPIFLLVVVGVVGGLFTSKLLCLAVVRCFDDVCVVDEAEIMFKK